MCSVPRKRMMSRAEIQHSAGLTVKGGKRSEDLSSSGNTHTAICSMEIRPCQRMAVFYSVAAQDRKERNSGLNLICYFYPDTVYIILSCLDLNTHRLLGTDSLCGVWSKEGFLLYSIFLQQKEARSPCSKTAISVRLLATGLHAIHLYLCLFIKQCLSQTLTAAFP